ncbi:MAG TPA: ABC transporter permease [Victivallales bacterium]|nr:ABC transporter permease [Victivallales bacterium]
MTRLKRKSIFELLLILCGSLILIFILAPILGLTFSSSINQLIAAAKSSTVIQSIWLTIWVSMAGTLFFSIFAVPFAYFLARKNFVFKKIISGIIDVPVVIPHSAAGIAILCVISRETIIGRTANHLGLSFINHPLGIMVAMAFVSLPYLINAARDGFESIPRKYEKAAYTLGASHCRVFFTISIPLSWRSILSGFVMMWGRGLSEFGAIVIIAYHPMVTSVLIYNRFMAFGLKYVEPVAVLFIVVCIFLFVCLRLLSDSKRAYKRRSRY